MKKMISTFVVITVALFLPLLVGCATSKISPAKTSLDFPGILKTPVEISGSGFKPNETVVVDLVLPAGVEIPGVEKGENVGLAFATADEKGDFSTKVDASAKLNFLFRVKWTPMMKPDFKTLNPIPPGTYNIKVTGMESGKSKTVPWEILPAPKKK
ncbi:MAG: hypothetical protein V2J25_12440 [Desulfatiglans sp.]|jgi:hypothetical protein|nr:hypothetical protein [Thermodesulfobacteriota bacterium]MEE4353669.1 hypothetical protein [Desulfatiglans sp.]